MKIEMVRLSELVPYENNAKTHPQEQIDKLAKEISDIGFTQPIVITSDKIIVCGHGRYESARQLGMDKVPVYKLSKDISPERVRAIRLFDNKIAESLFDTELLKLELTELSKFEDFDFSLTGFDDDFLSHPPRVYERVGSEPIAQSEYVADESDEGEYRERKEGTGAKELSESDFQKFDHECPKCGFAWDKT